MNRGRRRPLTADERRLWAEVARSIKPLPGRTVPVAEPEPAVPVPPVPAPAPGRRLEPPRAQTRPALPPLAPLEPKTVRALSRGQVRAESVIDLHGMTQAQAHAALVGFLRRAQGSGHRLVLVVTGKGRPEDHLRPSDRGVLRRMVPHWLALPELRRIVIGWTEAGPRQGGAGALYVRLRRAGGGA
ncbi:MAG: Smr protein/MutS2 [Enterovirga sp.]|jgi:DNA-nicking Smr family endonuclease|nr:Smr protein/MutS2 [Enterovirga sp.]